ncbi:hypothetical protein Ga0100231_016315 [Opitutaceae bacterium TAV4]|nr:hypothetical protein Ga0100231_016315 [Opitutaceae bacterium TAV4]RRJ99918.1 hypothetical protein Ga0100230_018035 [Opitutaceae bacterium TAV3]
MKNTTRLARLLSATICLLALAPFAQAVALDSWNQLTGTGSDLNTDHPSFTSGSSTMKAAFPSALTLGAVGDTLTFSGKITFTFPESVNGKDAEFRWGIFNHDNSSDDKNWLGYIAGNRSTSGGRLYEKGTGNGAWNSTSSAGYAQIESTQITGGTSGGAALAAGTYNLTFSFTREANGGTDGLRISWSLVGTGSSTYSLIGSWLDASPASWTYDRIGINIASGFGQTSAAFSELAIAKTSALPEPATIALLGAFAALIVALAAKRKLCQ